MVHIVKTDLFEGLIKCLHYDLSESVLSASLAVLTMLLPQICNEVSTYVSDLFIVYVRFANWEQFDRHLVNREASVERHISETNLNWRFTVPDATGDPTKPKIVFDSVHYGTILYGLFPLNLSKLCQKPLKYLEKHPPTYIDLNFIGVIHEESNINFGRFEDSLELNISEKIKDMYKNLLVHPKFIEFDRYTVEEERRNPIKWLLDQLNGDLIGPEEIALSCLGLNPDIMIHINGSLVSPENMSSKLELLGEYSDSNMDTTSNNNSREASRNSSIGSPVYFSVKEGLTNKHLQKTLQNYNRKMSIVPTNLFLDNPDNIPQESQEIHFNEVKFNDGKVEEEAEEDNIENYGFGPSLPPSPLLRHTSWKSHDPLSDLFSSHETLYRPKNKTTSSSSTYLHHHLQDNPEHGKRLLSGLLNDKLRSDLNMQRPISSPTTSLETATVHKGSISASSPTSNSPTLTNVSKQGTSLDYYHREVLLLKNELEFSSYMKHLNKFRYIRLKLNMNKMLREASLHYQAIEHKNNLLQIKSLEENKSSMHAIIEELRAKLEDDMTLNKNQQNKLIVKLSVLNDENKELSTKLEHLVDENKVMSANLHTLQNETIPEITLENATLRNKITELEARQVPEKTDENEPKTILDPPQSNADIDKKIYELKGEILFLNERIGSLIKEVENSQKANESMAKTYEAKLAASKLDVSEGLTSYTSQCEKKILELSTTILKYETLLDEKNSKIYQLSTSKPISIPGTPASFGRNSNGAIRMPGRSSRTSTSEFNGIYEHNSSMDSVNSPPPGPLLQNLYVNYPPTQQRPGTSTPQPIIKGRGGYQKRSKKIM